MMTQRMSTTRTTSARANGQQPRKQRMRKHQRRWSVAVDDPLAEAEASANLVGTNGAARRDLLSVYEFSIKIGINPHNYCILDNYIVYQVDYNIRTTSEVMHKGVCVSKSRHWYRTGREGCTCHAKLTESHGYQLLFCYSTIFESKSSCRSLWAPSG